MRGDAAGEPVPQQRGHLPLPRPPPRRRPPQDIRPGLLQTEPPEHRQGE